LIFFAVVGLWSLSADKLTIHSGFYKPTIPQSPPSHLQDYSTCNNARLEFSTIFVPSFDLKNGLHSGGLNPGPLGHESSALTTRPKNAKKPETVDSFLTANTASVSNILPDSKVIKLKSKLLSNLEAK